MESLEMYFGETRTITVEIVSCDNEPFNIRDPFYRFLYSDEEEVTGIPILDEHDLTVTFTPKKTGKYILEMRVNVANETLIRKLPIYVRN